MSIKPVGYRILIKPDPIDEKTKTDWGFEYVIGETNKKLERSIEIHGTLVAVGDQAWKAFGKDFSGTPWASPGDRIMFAQHAGRFVTDPDTGEEFILCNDEDITAVITN